MITNRTHQIRHNRTIRFVKNNLEKGSSILDLGTKNILSNKLSKQGFKVENTKGEDLDIDFLKYSDNKLDCVTAFEIFEHMLAPFNILKNLKNKKLIASVPLNLWFADSYWNKDDNWDKHYHEFEPRQFNLLLNRTGWVIKKNEFWKSPDNSKIGIRPILRNFYYRYYIVYCERD